jgi:hypothetical protein
MTAPIKKTASCKLVSGVVAVTLTFVFGYLIASHIKNIHTYNINRLIFHNFIAYMKRTVSIMSRRVHIIVLNKFDIWRKNNG